MESLGRRLSRLEARIAPQEFGAARKRLFEGLFHQHENARRELRGLEPLPDLPYTQEDREDDKSTLEETIPAYRNSGGWKREESKAFLDHWERRVKERLNRRESA